MFVKKSLGCFTHHGHRFIGRKRFQQFEPSIVFSGIGAESALVQLLILIPVVFDQTADLAGFFAEFVKRPCSRSADLPVVKANIADVSAYGRKCDEAQYRHKVRESLVNRFRNQSVFVATSAAESQ